MSAETHRYGRSDQLISPQLDPLALAPVLEATIVQLATTIGVRHIWFRDRLEATVEWIEAEFRRFGYTVQRDSFHARGVPVANLYVERRGTTRPEEIIVVGAHYDSRCGMSTMKGRVPDHSYPGTPGANDNASGIAATLALAQFFAMRETEHTLRFVAFVNEEPPFFKTPEMGSWVHAKGCRSRGEQIVGMFTPETLGYYTDEPGTQKLGSLFGRGGAAPGDFVAFLSDWGSRKLLDAMLRHFRARTGFPVVGVPVSSFSVPSFSKRVAWSDDWGFWQEGYPGVTVTDTAFLRYRHYHTPEDTPEKLVYPRMAQVVAALGGMLDDLDRDPELSPARSRGSSSQTSRG